MVSAPSCRTGEWGKGTDSDSGDSEGCVEGGSCTGPGGVGQGFPRTPHLVTALQVAGVVAHGHRLSIHTCGLPSAVVTGPPTERRGCGSPSRPLVPRFCPPPAGPVAKASQLPGAALLVGSSEAGEAGGARAGEGPRALPAHGGRRRARPGWTRCHLGKTSWTSFSRERRRPAETGSDSLY